MAFSRSILMNEKPNEERMDTSHLNLKLNNDTIISEDIQPKLTKANLKPLNKNSVPSKELNSNQAKRFLSEAAQSATSSTPRRNSPKLDISEINPNKSDFGKIKPRYTPAALGLQLTTELNNLEVLSSSIQQLVDMESLRQVSMAQAESVGLAQLLKVSIYFCLWYISYNK